MTLHDLGYDANLEKIRKAQGLDSFSTGRVIQEHRERYVVKTSDREYEAEIIGNLRYSADSRADFPAVGDWVAISEYDENKVLIHAVFPRKTTIERQETGRYGEKQIIASNVDCAFIVLAVDHDFNVNRIERYLAICFAAGIKPIIVLNKIDLVSESRLNELYESVASRIKNVQIIALSNQNKTGIEDLRKLIQKGKTYCLLGSSGVGKSTLLNNLSGKQLMKTNTISASTGKGRHVTTHRELVVLESGGIIIDNPGMREVGMTESETGLEKAFEQIYRLSETCRFNDCTHTTETGCAVLAAIKKGEIDESVYENFQKLEREKNYFQMSLAEKRKKDKDFGKMVKNFKKNQYGK